MNPKSPLTQRPPRPSVQKKAQRTAQDVANSQPPDPGSTVGNLRAAQSELNSWAKEFASLLLDKELDENKSLEKKKLEHSVVTGFLGAAYAVETENVGQGATATAATVMRSILMLRDKLNEIDYRITQIEKSTTTKATKEPADEKQ